MIWIQSCLSVLKILENSEDDIREGIQFLCNFTGSCIIQRPYFLEEQKSLETPGVAVSYTDLLSSFVLFCKCIFKF